jgi:Flp pilus assembly protein TadG
MRHEPFLTLRKIAALATSLRSDERGVVIILFAAALPVVLTLFLVLVDHTRGVTARTNLQNSLDAATLYVAKSNLTNSSEIQALGLKVLNANQQASGSPSVSSAQFTLSQDLRVTGTASLDVPVTISSLVGRASLTVNTLAEVARSSNNIEVGIALDVTGSMSGTPLAQMKTAAKELVDLIVKDQQTPHYSKVALVPYSNAVNYGTLAGDVRGTLSNGRCDTPGCQQYRFYNASGTRQTYDASTCVTERTGTAAYTDAAPNLATTRLGRHYIGARNGDANLCISSSILPLSTNRTALKNSIDAYTAAGSTAGHIGLASAWYMVSPNFGYLWGDAASRPAAYGTRELIKVVILMTDGEFNTAHADGVLSNDSGFGNNDLQINKNATNGSSHNQAVSLCSAIKQQGIILYTVGFNLNSQNARNLMQTCATSTTHAYLPSSGTALRDAFRAIAQEINSLRISR